MSTCTHTHTHKLTRACCNDFCRTAAPTNNEGANHNHCQPFLSEASFFYICWLGCKNHIALNWPCANKFSKNYQEAGTQFYSQKPSGKTFNSISNFKRETHTEPGKLLKKITRKAKQNQKQTKKSWRVCFFFSPQNVSAQYFASSAHVIFLSLSWHFRWFERTGRMSHWSIWKS